MAWFSFFFGTRRGKVLSMPEPEKQVEKRGRRREPDLLETMDVSQIPKMIGWLESRSETLRKNAHRSLSLYTGYDLGLNADRWRDWYEVNKDRPPHEWWADRLGHRGYNTYGLELEEQILVALRALDDPDLQVRSVASRLLGHLTGTKVLFSPEGSPKLRQWQIKRWKKGYERIKRLRRKRTGSGDL